MSARVDRPRSSMSALGGKRTLGMSPSDWSLTSFDKYTPRPSASAGTARCRWPHWQRASPWGRSPHVDRYQQGASQHLMREIERDFEALARSVERTIEYLLA